MKTLVIVFAVAIFISGLVVSPAAAAAPSTGMSSEACGHFYVVKRKDNLAKIAIFCETTPADIIALNPQIPNPNMIYPGQVLRITEFAPWSITGLTLRPQKNSDGEYVYAKRYPGARVSVSLTRAKVGDSVIVYVSGFPANTDIDLRLGKQWELFTSVMDKVTDANGEASATMVIPSGARVGDAWYVHAITTAGDDGAESFSSVITIIE